MKDVQLFNAYCFGNKNGLCWPQWEKNKGFIKVTGENVFVEGRLTYKYRNKQTKKLTIENKNLSWEAFLSHGLADSVFQR